MPNSKNATKTLVLNAGSSTIKFRLYEQSEGSGELKLLAKGSASNLGSSEASSLSIKSFNPPAEASDSTKAGSHAEAFKALIALMEKKTSLIMNITTVGHRVVHGGPKYSTPLLLTDKAIEKLDELTDLAPLHNHPSVMLIKAAVEMKHLEGAKHVAVFDTTFHRTMPEVAWRYALPYDACEKSGVRKYGFHGTSYSYVSKCVAKHLSRPLETLNLIILHLGNGASACAIRNGVSVDTSMGFTPLEGLMMGTRCGDIDASVPHYVDLCHGDDVPAVKADPKGPKISREEEVLNRESGLKGVCGDSDLQKVAERAEGGDQRAELALAMFCYRIVKYVGAYHVAIGGAHALVFTGGIGEHSAEVRARVCRGLECIGFKIDEKRNKDCKVGDEVLGIGTGDGAKVLVVATDEEDEIARVAREFLKEGDKNSPRA
ncbi:hypothetical protein HDU87_002635 [Geranomyces variabilis]|uniref:Probable acetate kinase n=1 Tax=Geranomyces variabilis TaxID=109894 RepID=A0AAD5TRX5_9FUNG|nr:hypothetical protein HDU87_002635 [Geranomyces variabilis]